MGKKLLLLVLAVYAASTLAACSGGTKATVGSQGGSAKIDNGVEFVFPQNAVNADAQVVLKKETPKDVKLPEGGNSDVYRMEINADVTTPITVKVKLTNPQNTESNLIGLGCVVKNSYGQEVLDFRYIDTKIEGDYAVGTYVPSSYSSDAKGKIAGILNRLNPFVSYADGVTKPTEFRTYVGVFTCAAYYKEGGHFKVYYPGVARFKDGQQIVDDLEFFYNMMLEKGYTYSKRTTWPFEVYIKEIGNEAEYCENGWWGRSANAGFMNIHRKYWLTGYQRNVVRPLLVHEWFHFVQANYTIGGTDSSWFDEATSTAYEAEILKGTPAIVNEYADRMWHGFFPKTDTPQDGYGRAPIIGYLTKRNGDRNFILEAYQGMAKGEDPQKAIEAATGDLGDWNRDCYRSITNGEFVSQNPGMYYKYVLMQEEVSKLFGSPLLLTVPAKDVIDKASETGDPVPLGTGTCVIPPYGARLFALDMSADEQKKLGEGMSLIAESSYKDDFTVDAFVIDNRNKGTLVPGDEPGASVEDLKGTLAGGRRILILVTNKLGVETTANLKVGLQMFPTLDELVGEYSNGKMKFEDIYFSEAMINEAREKAAKPSSDGLDFSGCDLELINTIQALEGEERPAIIKISKTGEETGLMTVTVINEGKASEPMPMEFVYKGGELKVDALKDKSTLKGGIKARYGKQKDVTLDGIVRFAGVEKPGEAYLDLRFTGSKPIIKP